MSDVIYRSLPSVDIDIILADAEASIARTENALRTRPALPLVYRNILEAKVAELREKQASLEAMYNRSTDANVGFAFVTGAIIAGGALITLIGAWALKHRSEAQSAERQAEAYKRMLDQGMDPIEAARLAYGTGGGISDLMNKALIITALIAGVVIFVKLT